MSGPMTAEYMIGVRVLTWAASQAQEMGEEYAALLEAAAARAAARQGQVEAQNEARQHRLEGLRSQIDQLEQRFARLDGLVSRDALHEGSHPVRPQVADSEAWSDYLRQLELGVQQLEAALVSEQAKDHTRHVQAAHEILASLEGNLTLDQVVALYLRQRQQQMGGSEHEMLQWRAQVARILERLELAAGDIVPLPLEQLARQVILADTPARAELLANELRLQVQRWREAQQAAAADMAEASEWLGRWPEFVPEHLSHLRQVLEAASAGLVPLDAVVRVQIQEALAVFEEEETRLLADAAGHVLEQSLQDLGYVVEEIESTLFLEGGTVHFQKPGWAGYFIRLRVNPREQTVNFNVVRAAPVSEGSSPMVADVMHHKRTDFMAEERWCAEFPRLYETLAARGLTFKVTRLLEAGELPVQVVAADTLPELATRQASARRLGSPLQARPLTGSK